MACRDSAGFANKQEEAYSLACGVKTATQSESIQSNGIICELSIKPAGLNG